MGKTPKKAAPGGDERNLYVRRLKTTTAPSRADSSFLLPERQRESESTNRPKLSGGIQKKISVGPGKNLKSKLRASAKLGVNQATKQLKLSMKNPETTDMQSESEEMKLNISIQKEGVQEENGNNKSVEIVEPAVNKEFVDRVASEQIYEFQLPTKVVQEIIFIEDEDEAVSQQKEEILLENNADQTKEIEEQDENDIKLTYEIEQSPTKNAEKGSSDKQLKDNNEEEEESSIIQIEDELKNDINEKESLSSELQPNNENYSVDIVESTTTEMSEISEMPESIIQSDVQKSKTNTDDTINNDTFISYDSSIMLKDVQIRLNDCLKDNSNLFDTTNDKLKDVELKISKYLTKDISFGKTLKDISGRRMLKMHERRISPNNSLFVNTSSISIAPDESKILQYSSVFSDSFPTNGSSLDRKRKINAEECSSMKKQKLDSNTTLLNRSTNLLRNFYRPVMKVSTPKATSYDFEPSKLDISGIKDDDNKIMTESTESTKKWCVIM